MLTTLVAPSVLTAGPAEILALAAAALIALRGGMMSLFLGGAGVLIVGRYLFG